MQLELPPNLVKRLNRLAREKHWPVETLVNEAIRLMCMEWEIEEGIYDVTGEYTLPERRPEAGRGG